MKRSPVTYAPRGLYWTPAAAVNAMRRFYHMDGHCFADAKKLAAEARAIGNVTVMHIDHDRNTIPFISEILDAIYIVDHETGSVLCWCAEEAAPLNPHPMALDVRFFDGTVPVTPMSNNDIANVLAKVARQQGLYFWSPRLYTSFPLCLFAEEGSSRRELSRYINRMTGGWVDRVVGTAVTLFTKERK